MFEHAKSGSESHILVVIGGDRKSGGLGLGVSQNDALVGVMGLVIAKSAGSVKQRDVAGMAPPGTKIH